MPLPRFQRLAESKRLQLFDNAAKEFAAKGFEAASLNEILAASGLGKSSYYYYFEDKEDLYAACIMDSLARLVRAAPTLDVEALTSRTFWPAIEGYVEALTSISVAQPVQMALWRELPVMRTMLAPRFEALASQAIAPMVRVIKKGQALGCVRTDLDAELLLLIGMAADRALDEAFLSGARKIKESELRAHAALVLDTWRRLLAPARTKGASVR